MVGLGRTLDGTRVIMLIDGYNIRIIHAATDEILRSLTIDPNRRYTAPDHPAEAPKEPENRNGRTQHEGSA